MTDVAVCYHSCFWVGSYSFVSEYGRSAGPKASLVSDMSTALISGFQILNL